MTVDQQSATLPAAGDGPTTRPVASRRSRLVYRHTWPIRLMHWINVIALSIMFFSGLQIFNAHPSLSWGKRTDPGKEILSMGARMGADGKLVGVTRVGSHEFITTGVLGVSNGPNGQPQVRGFPSWLTVPSSRWLAMGRQWHFFFAWLFVINGLFYIGYSIARKHLQRDLIPTRADWRGIGRSIVDHIKFKHPHGEEALRYNILQRLAYLTVIFVFGIGVVLMGLAMSPRLDAVLSPLVEAVGGRQSARTIHFIIAWGFVAFVLIHVFEVLISGAFNQLRGMITGWYKIEVDAPAVERPAVDLPDVVQPFENRPADRADANAETRHD